MYPFERADRMGTDRMVRRGLAPLRSATPSSDVWKRVAAELGPPPSAHRRPRWQLNLPMATLAGAMFLTIVATFSLNAGLGAVHQPGEAVVTEGRLGHGLLAAELAIQPGLAPRPVVLTLPPAPPVAPLSGWHHPQAAFNRAEWETGAGEPTLVGPVAAPDARLQ
jgi:hypothetical protein